LNHNFDMTKILKIALALVSLNSSSAGKFSELPGDIIGSIQEYLTVKDQFRFRTSCKFTLGIVENSMEKHIEEGVPFPFILF